MPFRFNSGIMAIFLDIQAFMMSRNTDETSLLQQVCDRLNSTLSVPLVSTGIVSENGKIIFPGAAGQHANQIKEIVLDYDDVLKNRSVKTCIEQTVPVELTYGLVEFGCGSFKTLPSSIQSLRSKIFPLTQDRQCIGLLLICGTQSYEKELCALLQVTAKSVSYALVTIRHLQENHQIQQKLKLAAAVFENSLEGIFITDTKGNIVAANDAVTRITGYAKEELVGRNPRILKSDRHDEAFYADLWASVHRQNQWQGEIWNKRKNNEIYPEWLSISAIKDENGEVQNYIGIFIDISPQKEAERRLNYLATHDKLTGLPNRDYFHHQLNALINKIGDKQVSLAVLFIDVDHFKYINDTFGHAMGDLLLQKVADKIRSCLRDDDMLARMGGDEFTILMKDIKKPPDAELIAQRILDAFGNPIFCDKQEFFVSVSIGISFYPEDAGDPAMLMRHADTAMYSAKNNGRSCLHSFSSAMDNYSMQRIEMESQLRRAIDKNEFQLFYQPQINLQSNRIVGAEALIRWQHPQQGLLMPNQFISLAEDTGLIVPIGQWVLQQACSDCVQWHRNGYPIRVAVNLSANQFSEIHLTALAEQIRTIPGLDPNYLELELTESLAMRKVEETFSVLNNLKKTGVQLSIDDFGTGYSSLSYLKQFPIDRLKIDRAFINDIASDANDSAIVVAIIAMAHCMGLKVIAEGIETIEQLQFLKMHHCDEVQGYLLGRPMPVQAFEAFLNNYGCLD